MVFDRLLASGDPRWGVHAVGMRQPGLVDALRQQDGLYLVRVADAQSVDWHVPTALWRLSLAATEREEVIRAMASSALRWITLTVTEKGYGPELGRLLAEGLARRFEQRAPGLTIASCDNLRSNGQHLQQIVLTACEHPGARQWIEARCAFPGSMVDRIVPASSAALREQTAQALGVSDASPLSTERFWEWVIEDRFADPADAALLRSAGVTVTDKVHVFEDAKLRMLNGSHSAMAIFGAITGRAVISDCIGHAPIRNFVTRLMEREVAPHLERADWADYRDALIRRFGNPYLQHSVHQIATDSSQKIPQRWPASILGQLASGRGIEHHALAAAAWLRYGLAVNEHGRAYEISDPQAPLLKEIAASQQADPQTCVERFLGEPALWGHSLAGRTQWIERVKAWHSSIMSLGMDASIDRLLREQP